MRRRFLCKSSFQQKPIFRIEDFVAMEMMIKTDWPRESANLHVEDLHGGDDDDNDMLAAEDDG